jgi:hypothetical protein
MEGREEEWQMNVYLLHLQRLSLFPASLFILHYTLLVSPRLLLPSLSLIGCASPASCRKSTRCYKHARQCTASHLRTSLFGNFYALRFYSNPPRTEALSELVDFFVKSCIQWAALRVDNSEQRPLTGHCMRRPRGPLNHRLSNERSSTWTI